MSEAILQKVEHGQDLSMGEMVEAMGQIMDGLWHDDQIARLLSALHRKGETVDEVAGAAQAMRQHMTRIRTQRPGVMDVVGTGGDASGTFNISTAAALVTAAAGVPVAKHGNRRVTSRSGSADVLAELGVNIQADVARVEACLEELGICFCFAPLLHRAMRHVAAVRARLPFPTLFNILGPLANPADAQIQLLGVGRPHLRPLLAEALAKLGVQRAVVVHGSGGLDEVSLDGPTAVTDMQAGQMHFLTWSPDDFGLPSSPLASLLVEGPEESAAVIRGVLQGRPGPAYDVVVANAAAALWAAGRSPKLADCTRLAAEAIRSGRALGLLERLVEYTNR